MKNFKGLMKFQQKNNVMILNFWQNCRKSELGFKSFGLILEICE